MTTTKQATLSDTPTLELVPIGEGVKVALATGCGNPQVLKMDGEVVAIITHEPLARLLAEAPALAATLHELLTEVAKHVNPKGQPGCFGSAVLAAADMMERVGELAVEVQAARQAEPPPAPTQPAGAA